MNDRGFKKIKDISPSEMAVKSHVHRDKKTVIFEGPKGMMCGWEGEDGTLYPGAVIIPSASLQAKIDDAKKKAISQLAKDRQNKVTLDDIKARREAGEDATQVDINSLVDLLLGNL